MYEDKELLGNTRYYRVKQDGKYGLLSKQGIEKVPCIYDSIRLFVGTNLLLLKKDGLITVVDRLLNLKIDNIEEIKYFESIGKNLKMACIKKEGKYGFIDESFQISIPCTYDRVYHFNKKGFCIVVLGDYYVLIDVEGNILCYIECDYMSSFSKNGFARARKGSLWGLVDMKGKIVAPFKYIFISPVDTKGIRFLDGEQINENKDISFLNHNIEEVE